MLLNNFTFILDATYENGWINGKMCQNFIFSMIEKSEIIVVQINMIHSQIHSFSPGGERTMEKQKSPQKQNQNKEKLKVCLLFWKKNFFLSFIMIYIFPKHKIFYILWNSLQKIQTFTSILLELKVLCGRNLEGALDLEICDLGQFV